MDPAGKKQASTPLLAFGQLAASLAHYPDAGPLTAIAIIGTGEGDGASTVSVNLAQTWAATGASVLLVRLAPPLGGEHGSIGSAEDILANVQRSNHHIHYAEIPADLLPAAAQGNEQVVIDILKGLRKRYSYVIWDMLPVDKAPQGTALCRYLQGVVLVVHAGKTRWHAARHTADTLKFSGVRMLGVVLNKKKMYIPSWIYRILFRYAS